MDVTVTNELIKYLLSPRGWRELKGKEGKEPGAGHPPVSRSPGEEGFSDGVQPDLSWSSPWTIPPSLNTQAPRSKYASNYRRWHSHTHAPMHASPIPTYTRGAG